MFNGVDVTFNVRNAKGITFSGGTSTGKVENDWCDIRAAVPENWPAPTRTATSSSPCQTSVRRPRDIIPKADVLVSRDRELGDSGQADNAGTDQLGSMPPTTR